VDGQKNFTGCFLFAISKLLLCTFLPFDFKDGIHMFLYMYINIYIYLYIVCFVSLSLSCLLLSCPQSEYIRLSTITPKFWLHSCLPFED
jgi:hypothetical protein